LKKSFPSKVVEYLLRRAIFSGFTSEAHQNPNLNSVTPPSLQSSTLTNFRMSDTLATYQKNLRASLVQHPDFPSPGVLFEDILPIFRDPALHAQLIEALYLQIQAKSLKPDVIVGLDARGFLFGPSLALKLNAGFVPVRKQGKMPGKCVAEKYVKEYGEDWFEMQEGGVSKGQKVLVVDDIIATGSALLCPFTIHNSFYQLRGKRLHRLTCRKI